MSKICKVCLEEKETVSCCRCSGRVCAACVNKKGMCSMCQE